MKNEIIIYLNIEKKLLNNYEISFYFKFTKKKKEKLYKNFKIEINDDFFEMLNDFEELVTKKEDYVLKPYSEYEIGKEIYDLFFIKELKTSFEDFFVLLNKNIIQELTLIINSNDKRILNIPFELIANEDFYTLKNSGFKIIRSSNKVFNDDKFLSLEMQTFPLKILFVSSLPENIKESAKFIEQEKERISLIEALGDLVSEQKVLINFLDIASLKNIKSALLKGKHNVLHISGHGNKGFLLLENEAGEEELITARELSNALIGQEFLKMVVLSACNSSEIASELINVGIPAVIGMRYPVLDAEARFFTSQFYKDICFGENISKAVYNARKIIYEKPDKIKTLSNYFLKEWFSPFVYLNQNIEKFIDYSKVNININNYFNKKTENFNLKTKTLGNGFVGRHKDSIELSRILKKEKAICIYGLGGLGKTTLAINFANNFKNSSYKVILLSGELTEFKILKKIIKDLNIIKKEFLSDSELSSVEKLQFLFDNYVKKGKIIFLFDNFEDNQEKGSKILSDTLRIFLEYFIYNIPEFSYILFTTRYKINFFKLGYWNITKMTFPEIYRLINLFDSLVSLSLSEKKLIYDKLGGQPRAIEIFAGLISENSNKKDILLELNKLKKEESNHDLFLNILWEKLDNEQKKVLSYASAFREINNISNLYKLLPFKSEKIDKILKKLNTLSLLYLSEDKFYVHRLSSNYILSSKIEKFAKKAINLEIAEIYMENLNKDEIYVETVLNIRWHYLQAKEIEEAFNTTYRINYLHEKGFADLILELYKEFENLKLSEKYRAYLYHQIAVVYDEKAKYDESLEYYNKALVINENNNFLSGIAINLGQLGKVYQILGEYDRAISYFEKSISIGENIKNLTVLARGCQNLGEVYQIKRDYKKALLYFDEGLKFAKDNKSLVDIANSYYDISTIYINKEFIDGALIYAKKAHKILKKIDDKSNNYAGIIVLLAFIDYLYENYNEALKKYKKALEIFKDNDNLEGAGITYYYLGLIELNTAKYKNSLFYFKKALNISETVKDVKSIAENHISIAEVYSKVNNKQEFLIHLFKAYEILKKLKLEKIEYTIYLFYEFMNTTKEEEFESLLCEIDDKINENTFNEIFDAMMKALEEEEKGGNEYR